MKTAAAIQTSCRHCGELCEPEAEFCCQGCETVYTLLQDSGMGGYYELETTPGVTQKRSSNEDLAYLNDETVIRKLIEYQDDTQTYITFSIPQIHCSSCIWLLEHLPRLNAGIASSRVDFPNRSVAVRFNHAAVSLAEVVRLLRKIGYEPTLSLATEGGVGRERSLPSLSGYLSAKMKPLWQGDTRFHMLAIGMLNGILPCGFVYVGLAGALTVADAFGSTLYMALFGLGTVPAMLAMTLAGMRISAEVRTRLHRAMPWLAIVLGILMVLRGMELGIPMISPVMSGAESCH